MKFGSPALANATHRTISNFNAAYAAVGLWQQRGQLISAGCWCLATCFSPVLAFGVLCYKYINSGAEGQVRVITQIFRPLHQALWHTCSERAERLRGFLRQSRPSEMTTVTAATRIFLYKLISCPEQIARESKPHAGNVATQSISAQKRSGHASAC